MFEDVVSAPVNATVSAFGRLGSECDTTLLVAAAVLAFGVATLGIRWLSGLQRGESTASKSRATTAQDEQPVRPLMIPHWIPWLGNALELVRLGFGGLARKYRDTVDGAPFVSVLVAGKTMHIVVDPIVFPAIFRHGVDTLSALPLFEPLWGRMFGRELKTTKFIDGPARKPFHFMMQHLLTSDDGLVRSNRRFQSSTMGRVKLCMDQSADGVARFRLRDFTHKVIFNAVLQTIVSKSVFDDETCESYWEFATSIITAAKGSDIKNANKPAYEARERIMAFLKSASFQPSDYMLKRRAVFAENGFGEEEMVRDILIAIWSSATNFIPSMFWMLYYVCSSKDTVKHLRREIENIRSERSADASAFDDTFTMDEVDKMHGMGSAFKEAIRMSEHTAIAREVMKDFTMDLKLKSERCSKYEMKKGDLLVMYHPILHHDEHVFQDPSEFQWDRFLPDESTGKRKVFRTKNGDVILDPFRGFGGGAHNCPARKFVTAAAKNFVASLIHQFDVEVEGTTEFDMTLDEFGILDPSDDVGLTIRPRQH
eukprot:CAMPEP_0198112484 /NCGR_PEP_ID=MMETSP1442-20131203/4320_1 /TAXON_ID= /ORGANISM="Craspedostauros australis, Strain CCMP3328" /LENGTH=539 /DNA_ID=CAMNT_0043769261 /DNA_START=120 /DNA_END=1739 /DNA_ORIENTATION=+